MKKIYLISFSLLILLCVKGQIVKNLAVIGSSTSACVGFNSTPGNCYINKLVNYYNSNGYSVSLRNLAIPGYDVYKGMPDGSPTYTANGRTYSIDPNANISAALTDPSNSAWHPDVIIVNFPTNSYQYPEMDIHTVMSYFRTIKKVGNDAGKPVFITTTQPRTADYDVTTRPKLLEIRDSINAQFGNYAVDFWTTVANPDGTIASAYDQGDGIHINAAGHDLFFQRLQAKNIFTASLPVRITSFSARLVGGGIQLKWTVADEIPATVYKLQRSEDGRLFQTIGQVQSSANSSLVKSYEFNDKAAVKGSYFYRIEVDEPGNKFYSRVEKCTSENQVGLNVVSSNATSTKIKIASAGQMAVELRIVNSTGQVIRKYSKNLVNGNNILILEHASLAKGVYWIEGNGKNGRLFSEGFLSQ